MSDVFGRPRKRKFGLLPWRRASRIRIRVRDTYSLPGTSGRRKAPAKPVLTEKDRTFASGSCSVGNTPGEMESTTLAEEQYDKLKRQFPELQEATVREALLLASNDLCVLSRLEWH